MGKRKIKKLIFGNKEQEARVEIKRGHCDFCGEKKECFCNMDNGELELQWVLKNACPSNFYECLSYGLFGLRAFWHYNHDKMRKCLKPEHIYFDKPQARICQDCAKQMVNHKLSNKWLIINCQTND